VIDRIWEGILTYEMLEPLEPKIRLEKYRSYKEGLVLVWDCNLRLRNGRNSEI
jgi:hypothetical protein